MIARALVSMTGWSIALVWIAYLLVGARCPQKDTLGRFRRWTRQSDFVAVCS